MKVEKITKTGFKYKITLNNGKEIETFDDVILENNLLFDKLIDAKLLEKIKTDTVYYDAYNKVLKLIERRIRSEKEIRDYLDKFDIDADDKQEMICNLKGLGLINDYDFARAYTHDKMRLTLCGPYKIALDLQNHNIDSVIVNDMINSYPEELIGEHIKKIIDKKVKMNRRYAGEMLKHKISAYLLSLGYSKDNINDYIHLAVCTPEFMNREMEKTYKSYSSKYSGDELYFKLKAKLLSKGFESSDVNNFLNSKK